MANEYAQYLETLFPHELRDAVTGTRDDFRHKVLDSYAYIGDRQVLLYGDVQSGKTSHMLGIVADCLDDGFSTIIILTSPNKRLVSQTYDRVYQSLSEPSVFKSDAIHEFRLNLNRKQPKKSVIVLGKIPQILENWLDVFTETKALDGKPIVIIDDEADATSLNTKVNKNEISRINDQLTTLRNSATGCIYIQVTGTPQAILLQTETSGWSASDTVYFNPGNDYVGGAQFFEEFPNPYTRLFASSEFAESLSLRSAVLTHLVTSSMFQINGKTLCNMMVHPSHRTPDHDDYKTDVKEIVDDVFSNFRDETIQKELEASYRQLVVTYQAAPALDNVIATLEKMEGQFKYILVNSDNPTKESDWESGFNFIVGGNSLGRGLTFDYLQTVFYVRESKNPQADTVWQHARMFGYKRHRPTLRWFLPAATAKMFSEVHQGNEAIKLQLRRGIGVENLRVALGGGVSPTRSTVLDKRFVGKLTGGVNYFASNPVNKDFVALDKKLNKLVQTKGDDFEVDLRAMRSILDDFKTSPEDLDIPTFQLALDQIGMESPTLTARIIVRTNRQVSHGTGTLLAPNDQRLARSEDSKPLLILYRIENVNSAAVREGRSQWSNDPIWVPNVRLPDRKVYYRIAN